MQARSAPSREARRGPLRQALVYAVAGVAWIVLTDLATAAIYGAESVPTSVNVAKGLFYIAGTTVLVWWLARRGELARWEELSRAATEHVLAGLGDAVFVIDPRDRTIRYCNDAAVRLFGWSREELIGQSTERLHVDEEAFEKFARASETELSQGQVFRGDFRMQTRDGQLIDTSHTVAPLDPERGWLGGVISVVRDVSQRNEAQRVLRRSEARFRQLVDSLPVGVFLCDPDGNILLFNDVTLGIWGREPEIGSETDRWCGSHRAYHPDGSPVAHDEQPIRRCVATRRPVREQEFEFERPDGSRVCVRITAVPLFDPDGELTSVVGCMIDVTAQMAAEESLRGRERLYRLLADNTKDIIWSLDTELRYTYVNPAVEDLFGYTPDELQGMHVSETLSSAEYRRIAELANRMLKDGGDDGLIVRAELLHKEGHALEVEIHASVAHDEQGNVIGLQGTTRDLRERRSLEEQVQQAQKMESVGRLAGGVAHDFNNMLSVIVGYCELLIAGMHRDDPNRGRLELVLDAGRRSADLTRQLLAFARQQPRSPEVVDLGEAIDGLIRMLRRLIREDIQLVWEPASDAWHVRVDPAQLTQVLTNLVVNAGDAITGGGTIRISTENRVLGEDDITPHDEFESGEFVCLAVEDDGCGMDAATVRQIFEPFFTTKALGEGTGLGLSTVYGIVRQNGGFVEVESEPGAGTTMRVFLPRESDETEPAGQESEPVASGQETVLVVEDEPALLRLTSQLLSELGYDVHEALGPARALELVADESLHLDLLVTDVIMPGMSGSELFEALRRDRPGLRCLYVSGYTADVIAAEGVLDPGVALLHKPFTVRALGTKVREVLDG